MKLGPGEWAPDPNNRPGFRVTEHWTVAAETPQARRRSTVENYRMSAKMTMTTASMRRSGPGRALWLALDQEPP
jgi:hypothetical protein